MACLCGTISIFSTTEILNSDFFSSPRQVVLLRKVIESLVYSTKIPLLIMLFRRAWKLNEMLTTPIGNWTRLVESIFYDDNCALYKKKKKKCNHYTVSQRVIWTWEMVDQQDTLLAKKTKRQKRKKHLYQHDCVICDISLELLIILCLCKKEIF